MSERPPNEYLPPEVSPPGETLRDTLQAKGMSQAELAERAGRPKKTINEIIQGKAAITPETALQLERVLGVPASFWIAREGHYRESLARREEQARLASHLEWTRLFPLREMVRAGWLAEEKEPVRQLQALLNFFGIASPEFFGAAATAQVAFRRSTRFKVDEHATRAWLRRGEVLATERECAPFDEPVLRARLPSLRSLSRLPHEEGVQQLQAACAEVGVALVVVPELKGVRASGATRWLTPSKALIVLSHRFKRDDHFWFSFFHECGHVLLHSKTTTYIDEDEAVANLPELEADQFARDTLIPPDALAAFLDQGEPTEASIRGLAEKLGLAPGIVVGRLQHDGKLPYSQLNHLKTRVDDGPAKP